MAYQITAECENCDTCLPLCPTGAIEEHQGHYWINPVLCNNCEGYAEGPQCLSSCPTNVPVPFEAKKGRTKLIDERPQTSYDLFPNGINHPFASAIAIWDACNFLAQRPPLSWQESTQSYGCERSIKQGRGTIRLSLPRDLLGINKASDRATPLATTDLFDMRAACLHLIFAAHATALDCPWEGEFSIGDRQIEAYLGLDKRKDMSKAAKLNLIKTLARQACSLQIAIEWPKQGRIAQFSLESSPLWHLIKIYHHFQEDDLGCKHLVGLTFTLRAGRWTQYFLNKQGHRDKTSFYQYGSLPKSLLAKVMGIWQQREGAARMLLWLLFKTRMGKEQRITVPTLMRIAYGEEKLNSARSDREERKKLIRTFESDLAILDEYGLKPTLDPVTYPPSIQPLWFKLADMPDDGDEAIEFWIQDGGNSTRLTDCAPRGKWNVLMNARILHFDLPADWDSPPASDRKKRSRVHSQRTETARSLSGEQIVRARKLQGWSQRELARRTGKSQSWIRDIENERFRTKNADQSLLRRVLGLQ